MIQALTSFPWRSSFWRVKCCCHSGKVPNSSKSQKSPPVTELSMAAFRWDQLTEGAKEKITNKGQGSKKALSKPAGKPAKLGSSDETEPRYRTVQQDLGSRAVYANYLTTSGLSGSLVVFTTPARLRRDGSELGRFPSPLQSSHKPGNLYWEQLWSLFLWTCRLATQGAGAWQM